MVIGEQGHILGLIFGKKELPMRDMRIINKRTGKISICVFLAAAAAVAE